MTKKKIIKKMIYSEVWKIFKETYKVHTPEPQSDAQKDLLNGITEFVYQKFGKKIKSGDLEKILKDWEKI